MFTRRTRQRLNKISLFTVGFILGVYMFSLAKLVKQYQDIQFEMDHPMIKIGNWENITQVPSYPKVFVVTPTFHRTNQYPELVRLAQAIYPSRHFVEWYIIDEYEKGSAKHVEFLKKLLTEFGISGVVMRSIVRKLPRKVKNPKSNTTIKVKVDPAKGVSGRMTAIHVLRAQQAQGVVFFADDDNTYDSDIFRQIQQTKILSAWPVGCVTDLGLSSPILRRHGLSKIEELYDGFLNRRFPIDFAGFAFNLTLLHENPEASIPFKTGYEETKLLESLGLFPKDIECLANNCTQAMAWHTKTAPMNPLSLTLSTLRPIGLQDSNIAQIYKRYFNSI